MVEVLAFLRRQLCTKILHSLFLRLTVLDPWSTLFFKRVNLFLRCVYLLLWLRASVLMVENRDYLFARAQPKDAHFCDRKCPMVGL